MSTQSECAGKRLLEERQRMGVSAVAAAEVMGVARNTLTACEAGRSDLSIAQVTRLETLDIDTFYVMTGERRTDFVAANANWRALATLFRLIREWEQARGATVTAERLAPLLEALYPRAAASREDEVAKLVRSLAA